jgi:hypothetical protein
MFLAQAQLRQQQIQKLMMLQKQHSDLLKELQLHATDGYSEFDTLFEQPLSRFSQDMGISGDVPRLTSQVCRASATYS